MKVKKLLTLTGDARGVLSSPFLCCCQSLPFFLLDVKCLNVHKFYGKTKRLFKVRICEHLGTSHLIGKKVKIDNKLTAIQEQLLSHQLESKAFLP